MLDLFKSYQRPQPLFGIDGDVGQRPEPVNDSAITLFSGGVQPPRSRIAQSFARVYIGLCGDQQFRSRRRVKLYGIVGIYVHIAFRLRKGHQPDRNYIAPFRIGKGVRQKVPLQISFQTRIVVIVADACAGIRQVKVAIFVNHRRDQHCFGIRFVYKSEFQGRFFEKTALPFRQSHAVQAPAGGVVRNLNAEVFGPGIIINFVLTGQHTVVVKVGQHSV